MEATSKTIQKKIYRKIEYPIIQIISDENT